MHAGVLLFRGVVFILPLLVVSNVFAESTNLSEEKRSYHLFNPAPLNLMRDLSTDRPDKTESAYTVDAGHFQIETSLIDYSNDKNNPEGSQEETQTISLVESNIKVGIINNVDLQLVLSPYVDEKTQDDSEKIIKRGFGDLQSRLKINLWGNDGGPTALAVMPFVKFPTNGANLGSDAYEGGIIIPLAIALPADWSLGLMAEFDFNQNSMDDDYHTEFIQSITVSHAIIGQLNGYLEFFSNNSNENDAQWVATVDAGLTYAVNNNVQLDMGVNFGVTSAADDYNPFCGLSVRY